MKKIILTLVMVFGFYLAANSQSFDCPIGWTQSSTTGSINSTSGSLCDYTIYYCWKLDENGQLIVRLRAVWFFDKYCLTGLDLSTPFYWQQFNMAMYNHILATHNLPIPPCPGNYYTISFERVTCWHLDDLDITYPNPNYHPIGLIPCDVYGGYCRTKFKLCWDYSANPAILIVSPENDPPSGIVCPSTSLPYNPETPPNGDSDCFSTCN